MFCVKLRKAAMYYFFDLLGNCLQQRYGLIITIVISVASYQHNRDQETHRSRSATVRRLKQRLKLLHWIYTDSTGIDKNKYLKTPHYISNRIDHGFKIREIACKTNYMKYSFFPRSISDWNKLPVEIVGAHRDEFVRLINDLWMY